MLVFVSITLFSNCQKDKIDSLPKAKDLTLARTSVSTCADCAEKEAALARKDEIPYQLSEDEIPNPFTIENMTIAYKSLYGQEPLTKLPTTHRYLKFLVSSAEQFDAMTKVEFPFMDYPLHKKVIVKGDFYIEPKKKAEDFPTLYAVVPIEAKFPADIKYEVLAEMFIPVGTSALQSESEVLLNVFDDEGDNYRAKREELRRTITDNPNLCLFLPRELRELWGEFLGCPPIIPDPHDLHDEPDPRDTISGDFRGGDYLSGVIEVENKLSGNYVPTNPIRNVKVILKQSWWKIDWVTTDNGGQYRSDKLFNANQKYSITIQFRNGYSSIVRYSAIYPYDIEHEFGSTFTGSWQKVVVKHPETINMHVGTLAARNYCAAVTHNGVQEYRDIALQEGSGVPQKHLRIKLSTNKNAGHGNTLMLHHFHIIGGFGGGGVALAGAIAFGPLVAIGGIGLLAVYALAPDIVYHYGGTDDFMGFYNTDRWCELVYHELGHATHFHATDELYWINVGFSEKFNCGMDAASYGGGGNNLSDVIAVAEGWAYHIGHDYADKKWGMNSTNFPEQGDIDASVSGGSTSFPTIEFSNDQSLNMSSHRVFLEMFDPKLGTDPNAWIPKGLMNDLIDEAGVEDNPVGDRVTDFDNQILFNALLSKASSMDEYKNELFNVAPASMNLNQSINQIPITNLFMEYGY